MKITGFNPLINSPKAEDIVKLLEELGFEQRHQKNDINQDNISAFDMKHPDGFRCTVAKVPQLPQDMTSLRMTVDNFDEAYEILSKHGFVNGQGGKITDTGTSKATLMVSPSGFSIGLSQHIKDKD